MAAHRQAQDFQLKFSYREAIGHPCFTAQMSFGLVNGNIHPGTKKPFWIFVKPLDSIVFFTRKGTPEFMEEPTQEIAREIRRLGKALAANEEAAQFLEKGEIPASIRAQKPLG